MMATVIYKYWRILSKKSLIFLIISVFVKDWRCHHRHSVPDGVSLHLQICLLASRASGGGQKQLYYTFFKIMYLLHFDNSPEIKLLIRLGITAVINIRQEVENVKWKCFMYWYISLWLASQLFACDSTAHRIICSVQMVYHICQHEIHPLMC